MAEVAGLSDAEATELCKPVDAATKVRKIHLQTWIRFPISLFRFDHFWHIISQI